MSGLPPVDEPSVATGSAGSAGESRGAFEASDRTGGPGS